MDDPAAELPALINALLRAPAAGQRAAVQAAYAPRARLAHALVGGADREAIVRIYQSWRWACGSLSASVHDVVYDEKKRVAVVLMTQHVSNYLHSLVSFDLPMAAVLTLEPRPGDGKLVIVKHEDRHSFEGMFVTLPLVGAALAAAVKRPTTWAMTRGASLAASLGYTAEALVVWARGGAAPPAGGAASGDRWERAKAAARAVWWRRDGFRGRAVPPYDPAAA